MVPRREGAVGNGARRLIVLPIRDYPDADDDFRAAMDDQVRAVKDWWADEDRLGERVFTPSTPEVIRHRNHVEEFLEEAGAYRADTDDVLVVHVTGHGHRTRDGAHYLLVPDGDRANPIRDQVESSQLVSRVAASGARQVLVIVNVCFAGSLDEPVRRALAALDRELRELDTVAVVVLGDLDERPRVRDLTDLLDRTAEAFRRTEGITAPELTLEQFLGVLDRMARGHEYPRPIKVWPKTLASTPTACLPNPGYQPSRQVVSPARRQVATRVEDLDYWLARATGRRDEKDGGWYFTGRESLTRSVHDFLAGQGNSGQGNALVVTGTAGSGKSAVIARAVTLSDPEFLAIPAYAEAIEEARAAGSLPPPESVTVAVLAGRKSDVEILEQLVQGLGEQAVSATGQDPAGAVRDQILGLVAERGAPVTLVLDGLDEAENPIRVIQNVIGPLSLVPGERPGVRWLIGVRSPAPGDDASDQALAGLLDLLRRSLRVPDSAVLRTDGPGAADDLAGYVEALLARSQGWYGIGSPAAAAGAGNATARAAVAQVVAGRVAPSFLDARFAASRLDAVTGPQPVDDPVWLGSLDEGTIGQLRQDLTAEADRTGYLREDLLAVLRATAFALGAGAPWSEVWPAMARAVRGAPIADPDAVIGQVVSGRLAGYLLRGVEDGRTVFSPVHQRLAEVLRDEPHRLREEPS